MDNFIDGSASNDSWIESMVAATSDTNSSRPYLGFQCSACSKGFASKGKLDYHCRITHRRNRTTLVSSVDKTTVTQLHVDDSDPITSVPKACCPDCDALVLPRNLANHRRRHSTSFECDTCSKTFNSVKDLKAHRELHQNVQVVCPECGLGFKSKAVFRSHRSRKHGGDDYDSAKAAPPSQPPSVYEFCPHCRKAIHRNSLKRHIRTAHSNSDETSTLLCEDCGKQLATVASLRRHRQIHDGEKRFECPICGQGFQTGRALEWHRKPKRRRSDCDSAVVSSCVDVHIGDGVATFSSRLSPNYADGFASLPSPLLAYSPPYEGGL